jgi:hypothetical protein
MQRRREIEGESSSGLMAHERYVEARSLGTSSRCLMQPCEADGLITESCQNFLIPQQAPAIRFKHQYRFANTTTGYARCMLDGYRFTGRDGWKPDVEARSNPERAAYFHGPVVFPDDLTSRREPKTVAVGTRRKEGLENPFQRRFVHAAPRIGN